MKRNSQQGVALVITLILLSVITFMTVTFLVVSRRERERTGVGTTQTLAYNAAKAGAEMAKAQLFSLTLGHSNAYEIGLIVSTNYISPAGFFAGNISPTNVNFARTSGGGPLSQPEVLQCLNNLLYLPRAPVYVRTNRTQNDSEARFFLDMNRNGVFETNGWAPWQFSDGSTNGTYHFFVGDPEWVGILDRPGLRHSSSNFFVQRYAYLIQPIGNSLDINFIHNHGKTSTGAGLDGFSRNQGFGSWEINLAAFLHDLNTNIWGGINPTYQYDTNSGVSSRGQAFQDALAVLRFRYNGDKDNLKDIDTLFGSAGRNAFRLDYIDDFGAGPLMTTLSGYSAPFDPDFVPSTRLKYIGWPGAENLTNFLTPQDLFNPSPYLFSFRSNLLFAASGVRTNSSYDRYTFYNLLAQMGTGSESDANKNINLNYKNIKGLSATNFVPWTDAAEFFTNAADRLIKAQFSNLSVTNIPIYPVNYYTPAVHRLLQLAANIGDAITNRTFQGSSDPYPSVFRPTFGKQGTNIFINGYVEVTNNVLATGTTSPLIEPFSLPSDVSLVLGTIGSGSGSAPDNINIYGIPWVIGARKGLPSFNEFSMQAVAQVTRKLQLRKPAMNAPRSTWETNVAYVVGISNAVAVEAWNPYTNTYNRDIDMIAVDEVTMVLTNESGTVLSFTNMLISGTPQITAANPLTQWTGYPAVGSPNAASFVTNSFRVPIYTNFIFVPDSVYRKSPPGLTPTVGSNDVFETTVNYSPPQFNLNITNRVRFIMLDRTTRRVIDYVAFDGLDFNTNISSQLTAYDKLGVWNTNSIGGANNPNAPTYGMLQQMLISLGSVDVSTADWNAAQPRTDNDTSKAQEISFFSDFYNNLKTNLAPQAPFTPSIKYSIYRTYQANDPLVHYTLGDLTPIPQQDLLTPVYPVNKSVTNFMPNIFVVNERYAPWGGNPKKTDPVVDNNLAYKDPLVTRADDWQFPSGKFPGIGWLGRVHRGTPWQTIYLKSPDITYQNGNTNVWQRWAGDSQRWPGNVNIPDYSFSTPTNDWRLLDMFTVAQVENATKGQLSVNQTNLAAWSAVLGGVLVLSNTLTSADLDQYPPPPLAYTNIVISPETERDVISNIVTQINETRRTNFFGRNVFTSLGELMAVPQLTVQSPFLNLEQIQQLNGISDALYERIPQQILSLLKVGEPRFVIYSYGQSLKPADQSIVPNGQYFGMCTNYQITGEVLTRSVVHIEQAPVPGMPLTKQPKLVVDSFNVIPPE